MQLQTLRVARPPGFFKCGRRTNCTLCIYSENKSFYTCPFTGAVVKITQHITCQCAGVYLLLCRKISGPCTRLAPIYVGITGDSASASASCPWLDLVAYSLLWYTWLNLVALSYTMLQLVALCCTWLQLDKLGYTWLHLVKHGCTWLHLVALGCTWLHSIALGCTWLHLVAPDCTWLHYIEIGCTMLHLVAVG